MKNYRVAVVKHELSHYREPIYRLLCQQTPPEPEYTLFADNNERDGIKTISSEKANISVANGGLRWRKIKNIWLGRVCLWQSGLIQLALDRKFNCIIYLGCMYFLSTWISAAIARLCGKRVLMWTHGYIRNERNLKGWIREQFYRLAHGHLLYGKRARLLMMKRGFDSQKLYVVYNSLNYEKQCAIRRKKNEAKLSELKRCLFNSPKYPIAIFIGRLTPQKKLCLLIKAAYLLKCQGVILNLLFVGEGPQKAYLEKSIIKMGIKDNVVFYGSCYNEEEIGPLIMLADVCVSPGEVGLTCMHALAYGTPVITHNDPDRQMPEWEAIKAGINGNFFKMDDAKDLARILARCLDRAHSSKNSRRASYAIIEEKYNPANQVKLINAAVLGMPAIQ